MRYKKIDNSFFIRNRKNICKLLESDSIAIFNSNDVLITNADGTFRFKQNNDLFYLTGIEQEETILLLYPDSAEKKYREVLFIRDDNRELTTWEGKKLTAPEATEISGIKTVWYTSEFEKLFDYLMAAAKNIYLNLNENKPLSSKILNRDDRFVKLCRTKYPLHNYKRAAPLIYKLRAVKSETEIRLMKKACELTEKGFRRVLKFVKPGVTEAEVEAELLHEFIRNNGAPADYEPIVASGPDSCTLHYVKNNKVCKSGDVLLIDFAASYANYNADMTRTIPVNGKFTKRQKQVYNAVLRVQRKAGKLIVPGAKLPSIFEKTRSYVESELIKLGLLTEKEIKSQDPDKPASMKYYPHNVSHFLGLDVHDVGFFNEPLAPGMILTCEPGIYIKDENFGIRLENNILVTKKGNTDLFGKIPIEADEIEELMKKK